jgi:hypothetical protein
MSRLWRCPGDEYLMFPEEHSSPLRECRREGEIRGKHLYADLHSGGLCCAGASVSDPARTQGGDLQIHHRHRANQGQKLLAINGVADHLHLLIGMKPDTALSDLVRDIKAGSSKFINERGWIKGKFHWQEGFGGFSYGHSQLDSVISYIRNQE